MGFAQREAWGAELGDLQSYGGTEGLTPQSMGKMVAGGWNTPYRL